MFARVTHLTLALTLAVPTAAIGQSFEYAPSTGQYRITSITKGSQEAMGQKNDFETSSNQFLSVTVVRAHKDTLDMTATLDSISMVGPMGMTPPGLDKLVGVKVTSKLAPFGLVYSAQGPKEEDVPNATQLTDEMSRIFPRIRAKLMPGAAWTDTAAGKVKQGGIDIDRKVVSKFVVVGDTTVSGEKSWKITRESTATFSGSGAPSGQPMTMEGTSAGKGTVFMSQRGVFVGMNNEEQVNIKIILAANGMEVGVVQTATTKVEKVK